MGLTDKKGVDCVIDAVGVDAEQAHKGPAVVHSKMKAADFEDELKKIAPKQNPSNGFWHPGDAPSQVLNWAVESVSKGGNIGIIGVYPEKAERFPIGKAMMRNLTIRAGNCNHRKYIPKIINLVRSGVVDPSQILTQIEPVTSAIDAYKAFDTRSAGWIKVELLPEAIETNA